MIKSWIFSIVGVVSSQNQGLKIEKSPTLSSNIGCTEEITLDHLVVQFMNALVKESRDKHSWILVIRSERWL